MTRQRINYALAGLTSMGTPRIYTRRPELALVAAPGVPDAVDAPRQVEPEGGKDWKEMKTQYTTLSTGQRIRISPMRPWRGKSERRRVLKQRRIDREAARQE